MENKVLTLKENSMEYQNRQQSNDRGHDLRWMNPATGKRLHAGKAFYEDNYTEYRLKIDELCEDKQYYLRPVGFTNNVRFFMLLLTALVGFTFIHEPAFAMAFESKMRNLTGQMIGTVLPLLSILGLIYAAMLAFFGDGAAKASAFFRAIMSLSHSETKRLIELALKAPLEDAREQVYAILKVQEKSEGQFYDGIIEHGPSFRLTFGQCFELLSRFRNRMLRSQLDLENLLSEEQLKHLPPITG